MSEELQKQIDQLQGQMTLTKSRAFDMQSSLTAERDQARQLIQQYEDVIKGYGEQLDVQEGGNTTDIANAINLLKSNKKKKAA